MYPIAIVGNNPTARAAILACRKAGFEDLRWLHQPLSNDAPPNETINLPATTLPANLTRVIAALVGAELLSEFGHRPDREQIRFARSAFLLSELPLGQFTLDRYGAPHINITAAELDRLLDVPIPLQSGPNIETLANEAELILVCEPESFHKQECKQEGQQDHTHELWYAQLPADTQINKANLNWQRRAQTIWQFGTKDHTHYLMSTHADIPFHAADWHPSLSKPIEQATLYQRFSATHEEVRQHWYTGNVVYLGEACYAGNPYRRESTTLGLEDAWVLSRMLENYEEDIHDALSEYEKYRRARTRRVAKATALIGTQYSLHGPMQRMLRNLNTAFSTRFLPEIAMQRIDWLYNYDCIRGFR